MEHMDVISPAQESCQASTLSPQQNANQQKHENNSDHMPSGSGEFMPAQLDLSDIRVLRPSPQDATNDCNLQRCETPQVPTKNTCESTCSEMNVSSNLVSRKYSLRSSLEGDRDLQSKTVGACETPDRSTDSVHVSTERRNNRQRRKGTIRVLKDEFFSLKKRFRYLLTRMSYEQSLIDAYSGEGWKGQSLEKLRPEKELQRATSEIVRCKLEMRDLVKHIDALCAEGKIQASFASQGHIYCEDIFCAKCGSKDSSANNDIILCDGICDRGFHQMCLVPPLLNEEIPPGDEIWLCPGCKCKLYCIDLLNDVQGTHLSIQDKWEKVFPEAAGDKQCVEFQSDDSEDNDYDPDGEEHDKEVPKECSGSEESNFTSASDDSSGSAADEQHEGPGISSADSEDSDYAPSGPNTGKKVQKEGSSSDESDFTSDSDNLSALCDVNESPGSYEDPLALSPGCSEPVTRSRKGRSATVIEEKHSSAKSEQLSMLGLDLSGMNASPVPRKRHHERLDYKKLFDEAYGNIPSDSSEDEDWSEMNTPKKVKNDDFGNNNVMSSNENTRAVRNGDNLKVPQSMPQKTDISPKPRIDQERDTENTPNRITYQKLESEGTNHSVTKRLEYGPKPDIGNKATTSGSRCFGKEKSQRLYESLRINVYPTRETKESLSKDLGITVRQISRWFENARRSLRLSANKEQSKVENVSTNNDTGITETNELDIESRNGGG